MDRRLPAPLPRMTPLFVKFVVPVPPLLTLIFPEVMIDAGSSGMSDMVSVLPNETRPFASTATF